MPRRTADRAYRQLRARALAPTRVWCHLCGEEIDKSLPAGHPMSATADHLVPYGTGGSNLGLLAPAHLSCNSRKGKRTSSNATRSDDRHAFPW